MYIMSFVSFFQTYFPYKLIQVHFINVPSYAAIIFNILKSLVPKKIQSRVSIRVVLSDMIARYTYYKL